MTARAGQYRDVRREEPEDDVQRDAPDPARHRRRDVERDEEFPESFCSGWLDGPRGRHDAACARTESNDQIRQGRETDDQKV